MSKLIETRVEFQQLAHARLEESKVIGLNDSLAQAALALTKPTVADRPFTVLNPKPYSGMTRFGGSVLGGISVEGAYIYPSAQAAA